MSEQKKSQPARGKGGLQVFDPQPGSAYTLEAVCHLTGLSRRSVLLYCRNGLIKPVDPPGEQPMSFDEEAIYLIRRAEALRNEHGVNIAGLRLVFRLLREIEELRREMKFLR